VKKYALVIEKGEENYSAYSPDVPGCAAAVDTLDEVRRLFREALALHLEGLAEDGDPIPEPSSVVEYLDVPEPASPAPVAQDNSPTGSRQRKKSG